MRDAGKLQAVEIKLVGVSEKEGQRIKMGMSGEL
jgi:hypothetical protein